ncbi:MAG: NUDIX domain-containing protein [Gammaproteobacteria bacterium]|nr:NUDIX domain-containing protein [Gammaproteobacteria bacterium]
MKQLTYRDVDIVKSKKAYDGFFSVTQYTLKHKQFDESVTQALTRECFERGHAVGVLAYDPWQDSIVLLEQFRIGAYIHEKEQREGKISQLSRAQQTPWLLEIIAGIVEPGESHVDVAHREAEEEAGLKLLHLENIGDFYSSPGGSSEMTQLYCACVNSIGVGGVHGLEEEGEDIRVFVASYSDAVQMLKNGRLNNASAMIAMQWLMLHHEEIQAKWTAL